MRIQNSKIQTPRGSRMKIPTQRTMRWSGVFPGEEFGSIYFGKSIDLERNKGKIGLADSYSDIANSGVLTNLTTPVAFVRSSADGTDRWWANGGRLFKTTTTVPNTGWTQDALVNTPTAPLYDLIDFSGALICPISTDLSRLSGGVWTASWWQGTLAQVAMGANPHRFAILAGALLITDGRYIHDYDGTIARTNALTLPQGFQANFSLIFRELAYCCGQQIGGGEAYVYTWDRIATNYISRYPVGDTEVLAGFVADSVYIITKKGLIKKFDGSGFVTVQQFPTVEAQQQITSIHPNGISVSENIVKILVNFGTISNARLVSGIWNYDISTKNLYNAGSVKNTSTKDYAQHELADVGALKQTIVGQGLYLIGARAYTAYSSATIYGIYASDENATNNQGYFITPKFRSSDIQRYWRKIFATMRRMTGGDDRFRIAERTQDSNVLPAYETITWTAANTFTATNADIQAGDFVEVLAGDNAGALARIVTYTGGIVTLDRSLYASTSTSRVRYLRFTDLGTISNVQIQTEIFYLAERSPWIQLLCEFRGTRTSPVLESLMLDYKELPQVSN